MAISDSKPIDQVVQPEQPKKKNWLPASLRKWLEWNQFLRADVEFRKQELMELQKKGFEREEEMQMIKKLARTQVEEVADLYRKVAELEQKYHDANTERNLLKSGVERQDGEIKALALICTQKKTKDLAELWSPVVFTISEDGTKILNREAQPDTERKYALDNAKIAFQHLFDPEYIH